MNILEYLHIKPKLIKHCIECKFVQTVNCSEKFRRYYIKSCTKEIRKR